MEMEMGKRKMDSKKIAGQLGILLAIVLFIAYPALNKMFDQHRVSTLIQKERYEEAYEILKDKEIEPLTEGFINLMICEVMLEEDVDLTRSRRVKKLLVNPNEQFRVDLIQKLIDVCGPKLGHHLIPFYEVGSKLNVLEFSQDSLDAIAFHYLERGKLDNAMAVRGDKETYDFLALQYDLSKGNLQKALDGYSDIPKEYQKQYWEILSIHLLGINKLNDYFAPILGWEWDGNSDLDELIEEITALDFPDEIMMRFVARLNYLRMNYYTPYGRWDESTKVELDKFFRHPMFTSQDYFEYYESIAKLPNFNQREMAIEDLANNTSYTSIDTRDKIVDNLTHKTALNNGYHISKDGIMMFYHGEWWTDWENSVTKRYDLVSNNYLEDLEKRYIVLNSSPDRTYFGVTPYLDWDNLCILDSHFDEMISIQETETYSQSTTHWIDNKTIVFLNQNSKRMSYNPVTGVVTEGSTPIVRDPLIVKRYNEIDGVWAVGEETYSALEAKVDYQFFIERQVYTVRSLADNTRVLEVEVDHRFVGACKTYVYQLEEVELGFYILTATCKETKVTHHLPFYTFS